MKAFFTLLLLMTCAITASAQQYPKKTIMEIMNVPADTLSAGSLHSTMVGDTVIVRGLVSIPPVVNFPDDNRKIMIAGNKNYAIYLQDETGTSFAGMPILCDTSNASSNFVRLKKGQLIEVPIRVTAFPTNNPLGTTQGEVISKGIVEFIDDGLTLPTPPSVSITNFLTGKVTAPNYNIPSGAKYVGMKVEFSNLTVVSAVKSTSQRTTIILADENGNEMYLRDQSNHFRTDAVQLGSFVAPTDGARIKKIRGYISTNSIAGQPVPFMISPGMPEDLEVDNSSAPPVITSVRSSRTNAFPTPNEVVPIAIGVRQGAKAITAVKVQYSFDGNAVQSINVVKTNDTLWTTNIPAYSLPSGSNSGLVKWFVTVSDESGLNLRSPLGDTTGIYYRVLNRASKISDIRERFIANGSTSYEGYLTTITGTVTASAADIPNEAANAPRVYIQDDITPYSGIFIRTTSPSSIVRAFPTGSKVEITGIIRENFGVTSIDSVIPQGAKLISTTGDNIVPIVVKTIDFARKSQGSLPAESFESMLVQFNDVIVADTNADGASNFGEFSIVDYPKYGAADESTSKMRVETDDGATNYGSSSAAGKTVMPRTTGIKSLKGIMYYSFGNYKLVPRTNADIMLGAVSVEQDVLLSISNAVVPHPVQSNSSIHYTITQPDVYTIAIYDIHGSQIQTLCSEYHTNGEYSLEIPSQLSNGIYQYRLMSDKHFVTNHFTVTR